MLALVDGEGGDALLVCGPVRGPWRAPRKPERIQGGPN